jgi:transposase-like protein
MDVRSSVLGAGGAPERSGGAVPVSGAPTSNRGSTEVLAKARRRQFSAKYKLAVLEEADRCTSPGAIGALLRREGLYSSHLTGWREARRKGSLAELSRTRGQKPRESAEGDEVKRLRKENERLRQELRKAQTVIEVQKNSPS